MSHYEIFPTLSSPSWLQSGDIPVRRAGVNLRQREASVSRAWRSCHDCGAFASETPFPGPRKPSKRPDRCCDCTAAPLEAEAERVTTRLKQIAAMKAAGKFRPSKPFHTAPLFRGLRP